MSRNEKLIETLRGSIDQLENVETLFDGMTIFNEHGYVDSDFMMAMLISINRFQEVSARLLQRMTGLFEQECPATKKKTIQTESEEIEITMELQQIFKDCRVEEGVLKLPEVQLDRSDYLQVKKVLEGKGGKWKGGKVQGFVFSIDAAQVLASIQGGDMSNRKKTFQFFATPAAVADRLAAELGGVSSTDKILEPSAGQGALVAAIRRLCPDAVVDCYEIMPENRDVLMRMEGVRLVGEDFTKAECGLYDKIIANPPFANNQDIRHVRLMYEHLKPGGVLATITGPHWQIASTRECKEFANWLDDLGAKVESLGNGAFKESGTQVQTLIVTIHKPKAEKQQGVKQLEMQFE